MHHAVKDNLKNKDSMYDTKTIEDILVKHKIIRKKNREMHR